MHFENNKDRTTLIFPSPLYLFRLFLTTGLIVFNSIASGQVNGDNQEKIKALDNRIESRQAEIEKLKKEKDELDKNFAKQKEVATQAQQSAESLMDKNLSAAKSLKENSLSKKKSNVAYKNAKASRKASKTAREEVSKANAMEKRVKKMNKRISKSEKELSKLKSQRETLL